ncbi:MAG: Hsp20/alpha crystallin family protein [Verrucomicrobia bacterium]|nr:Hsp20/alpha crystallin family protein [Verrucomicrobiota bacterium]MCH8513942.1 Hsp20/alpha crystallin family protein [Kiritimatiellia bacterium]
MVHIRNPWNFQDLYEELDRMTRDFSRVFDLDSCLAAGPETGLELDEDGAMLALDLPGVSEDELSIALENNRLRIEARREDSRRENEDVILRERSYGEFSREYSLPWPVKEDGIQAEFRHGVLRVRLPKAPEAKPRSIPVKVHRA